ncbi:MAG: hypothetical protein ACRD22_18765, partial [Terriglobia bacterium]
GTIYQWPDYECPTGYVAIVRDIMGLANLNQFSYEPAQIDLWCELVTGYSGIFYSIYRKDRNVSPWPFQWQGRIVLNAGEKIGLRHDNILTYTAGYMGGYLLTAP